MKNKHDVTPFEQLTGTSGSRGMGGLPVCSNVIVDPLEELPTAPHIVRAKARNEADFACSNLR